MYLINGSSNPETFLKNNEGDNETMDDYGKYIHFSDRSMINMLTIKYNILISTTWFVS